VTYQIFGAVFIALIVAAVVTIWWER